jgi:hypothetical protein
MNKASCKKVLIKMKQTKERRNRMRFYKLQKISIKKLKS